MNTTINHLLTALNHTFCNHDKLIINTVSILLVGCWASYYFSPQTAMMVFPWCLGAVSAIWGLLVLSTFGK